MSDKEHIDLLIEKYTRGKLEGQELQAFEKMLREDAELSKKVEAVKLTNQLVILNRLREVNSVLKAETALVKERDSGYDNKGKIILGVSILALLISTVFLFSKNEKETGSEQLKNKDQNLTHTLNSPTLPFDPKEKTTGSKNQKHKTTIGVNDGTTILEPQPSKIVSISDFVNGKAPYTTDTSATKKIETKTVNANPDQTEKKLSCESVMISADVKKEAPCRGEQNGRILLTLVKGGTAPYSFILNGTDENSQGQFIDLSAGTYEIKITDRNGCHIILNNLTLSEKLCNKHLEFSPSRGEELTFPVYEKSGNLSIFDKTGKLYYQQSISSGEKFSWNGQSGSGEIIVGYYVFVIQYEEGSVQKGSITIAP